MTCTEIFSHNRLKFVLLLFLSSGTHEGPQPSVFSNPAWAASATLVLS